MWEPDEDVLLLATQIRARCPNMLADVVAEVVRDLQAEGCAARHVAEAQKVMCERLGVSSAAVQEKLRKLSAQEGRAMVPFGAALH